MDHPVYRFILVEIWNDLNQQSELIIRERNEKLESFPIFKIYGTWNKRRMGLIDKYIHYEQYTHIYRCKQ